MKRSAAIVVFVGSFVSSAVMAQELALQRTVQDQMDVGLDYTLTVDGHQNITLASG